MLSEQTLYWIWLARACGVASKSFVRLISRFLDPFEIYSLDEEQIEHIEGIGASLKVKLCDKSLEESYSVLRFCKKNGVDIISYGDKRYPTRLRLLEDAPTLLFCKGKFPDFDSRVAIGVVGTRKMSEYGKQSAYKIAYEMAAANVIVVSGMALGIDGVSACGAIGAGGDTVAVLGSGIDVVYPKQHTELYKRIAKCGCVISEYMPSTPPEKYNFPIRNRIISGLCQGTLVVDGDRRSGSLITAKDAIAQGREVFALPGKINEINSEGPNELIRDGAYAVLEVEDILSHYDFLYHDAINYSALRKAKKNSQINEKLLDELDVYVMTYGARSEESPVRENDSVALAGGKERKTNTRTKSKTEGEKISGSAERSTEAVGTRVETDGGLLAGLEEGVRRVFEAMPIDSAVSPDSLVGENGDVGDTITALTMLELCGLVTSLPGGLYIRK